MGGAYRSLHILSLSNPKAWSETVHLIITTVPSLGGRFLMFQQNLFCLLEAELCVGEFLLGVVRLSKSDVHG